MPRRVRVLGLRTVVALDGPPDRRIAVIAGHQRGLVSRRQLLAAGLTDKLIKVRIRRGQLDPRRRGVYSVGPTDTPLVDETEALLVCGSDACLSHLSAVRLWALMHEVGGGDVEVTVPAGRRGSTQAGIDVHRSGTLAAREIRVLQGLPVTSVERTLIDAGPLLLPRELERALDEALARRLTTAAALERAAAGTSGRGAARVRRLLTDRDRPLSVTRSEAEERLLALIRAAALPVPRLQTQLHGFSVDFYWPRARFAVEFDGYAWHTNKSNFTRDRRKDRVLTDHGITLTRVSWDQIQSEPLQLVAHFARRLAAAS